MEVSFVIVEIEISIMEVSFVIVFSKRRTLRGCQDEAITRNAYTTNAANSKWVYVSQHHRHKGSLIVIYNMIFSK